jgi:hypothetical protein
MRRPHLLRAFLVTVAISAAASGPAVAHHVAAHAGHGAAASWHEKGFRRV